MSVEFKDISEIFGNKGLKLPMLKLLVPDIEPYEVLAIQPFGPPTYRAGFVGNSDSQLATRQFSTFFELAVSKNADLVISPEYSCPWNVLTTAFNQGTLPQVGKLWALGCESITPVELEEMISNVPGLLWICETPPVNGRTFLDVVCYVLRTEKVSGEPVTVALLQCKTVPMAGAHTFERDNLILGTKRYFLRNRDRDFLRFYTMICSEALDFKFDEECAMQFEQHPPIIFHPQLVEDTRHAGMRTYRNDIFQHTCSNHLEVISLNWAHQKRDGEPPSIRGNSGLFMKSDRFDRSDGKVCKNHSLGIYYSRWKSNETDLCLFNFDQHIFHFVTQKVKIVGRAVQDRRTGPEMLNLWDWKAATNTWTLCAMASDGFDPLCAAYGKGVLAGCLETHLTRIDQERLLTLSAGTFEVSPEWYYVKNMKCFIAEADERSKRLTFTQELNFDSRTFRNDHITRYIRLRNSILVNEVYFPPSIQDLKKDWQIIAPQEPDGFRFNAISKTTKKSGATLIFLGALPSGDARKFLDLVTRAWGTKQNTFREETTRRIVVWYEDASMQIKSEHNRIPEITDDSETPASIMQRGTE